jgi:hypothetical protein
MENSFPLYIILYHIMYFNIIEAVKGYYLVMLAKIIANQA